MKIIPSIGRRPAVALRWEAAAGEAREAGIWGGESERERGWRRKERKVYGKNTDEV